MSTSPAREGSANAGSSNGNQDEKPRLSEHEKKANHIASGKIYPFCIPANHASLVIVANIKFQSRNADKQSAKVSIALPSWYQDWRDKDGARVLS